jgi:hypothetical protein
LFFGEEIFGNKILVENRFGYFFLLSFLPHFFKRDEKRGKNNQFVVFSPIFIVLNIIKEKNIVRLRDLKLKYTKYIYIT